MMTVEDQRQEQMRRVDEFADWLKRRLDKKADDPDKRFLGWETDSFEELFVHLGEETGELAALIRQKNWTAVATESVDVAAMAFMIWDNVVGAMPDRTLEMYDGS